MPREPLRSRGGSQERENKQNGSHCALGATDSRDGRINKTGGYLQCRRQKERGPRGRRQRRSNPFCFSKGKPRCQSTAASSASSWLLDPTGRPAGDGPRVEVMTQKSRYRDREKRTSRYLPSILEKGRGRTSLLGRKAKIGDAAVGRFVGLSEIGLRLREERGTFGREAKEMEGLYSCGRGQLRWAESAKPAQPLPYSRLFTPA